MRILEIPPLPEVDPASVEPDRQRLFEEAAAQIQSDFPNARLRDRPAQAPAAAPGVPAAEPARGPVKQEWVQMRGGVRKMPEPVKEPEDEPMWISKIGRSLAENTGRVTAQLVVDPANAIGDLVPDWLDAGLVIDKDGIRFESGDAYADKSAATKLGKLGDNLDFGGRKNLVDTEEDIKAQWKAGNKGTAALNAVQFGVEQGIISLPDMVAILYSMPQYTLGLGADYAQQRAANDGRSKVNPADAMVGLTTAVFVSALEKVGAEKVFGRLLGKGGDKSKLKEWFAGILGEGVTEATQNPVEFAGTRVGTAKEGEITPGRLAEESGFGALGGIGGGATLGGGAQLLAPGQEQAPPPTRPPRQDTTGQPPPGATPATTGTPPGPPPPTTGQPPTAPSGPAGLAAGRPAIFKPNPSAPGVAVMVNEVDPATNTAKVVRLDEETGEPITDDEGNQQEFVANFADFPELAAAPAATPSPVAPAVPQGGPPPSQVPPAATTTEPTSDVAGQIKDMWNAKTKRRGVYLSPPTVAKMKEEGTYAAALKAGTVEENFDGQGGTLIVKSKKDMEEARAARDGGQTDMQAIVGTLTGAGVAKPDVPNAQVVQRKDETGAVVQQSAVAPEDVQQTVQEMEQQPGTVEVTTPEAVIEERAQKVELEGAPQRFALNTPDRTLTDAAGAVAFVEKQLDTPAEGKLTKPDVRGVAGTIGAAGAALRAATAAAKARGAPDALITAANKAVAGVEKFENKTEKDFFKARGVSESILRERTQALADALQGLVDWHNANPNATAQAPAPKPAKPAKSKAEKAKAVSKAKEAPAREERRKAENAALRERVEKMTEEEKVKAIMTDQRTGLPNKRAMEELRKANPDLVWTKVDADSLKWVNENMSEKSGDELLKAIAEELQAESDVTPHHTGGDEFYVAGESAEGNDAALQRANTRLKDRTIRHGRTEIMPQMTWGKGFTDIEKADASMVAAKEAREAAGKRAKRGEKPGSVRDVQQEKMNLPEPTAQAEETEAVEEPTPWKPIREKYQGREQQAESDIELVNGGFVPMDDAVALITAEAKAQGKEQVLFGWVNKYFDFVPRDIKKLVAAVNASLGRKKKAKYVPPKKREQTVYVAEEKAAEEVQKTVAAPDTIGLAPANVKAADLPTLAAEIVGITPRELAAELENDNTQQLSQVLTGLIEAVGDRGGWPGWFVATLRGDILGDRKNELKGLIRQFIGASKEELPAIREQILGLMTNLDGRTLPMQSIQSVFEAAQIGRAYNSIREALLGDTESDLNALAETTEQSAFDQSVLSRERPGGAEMSVVDAGELGTTATAGQAAPPYTLEEMTKLVKSNKVWKASRKLANMLKLDGRWQKMTDDVANGRASFSLQDFARVIRDVSMLETDPDVRTMGDLIMRIADHAPNIPVEFTHPSDNVVSPRGQVVENAAAGYFYFEGVMQMNPPRSRTGGTVAINDVVLRTFFHEAVHAATAYELKRNPKGPFARRLTAIRVSLIGKAGTRFGQAKVREALEWYRSDRSTPAPKLVEEHGRALYALVDNLELVAESLTSPAFAEFLRTLDGPKMSWVRHKVIRPFMAAVRNLLGIDPSSKQDQLLSELSDITLRVMQAQSARALRYRRVTNTVMQSIREDLGLKQSDAREFLEKLMTVVSEADLEQFGGQRTFVEGAKRASAALHVNRLLGQRQRGDTEFTEADEDKKAQFRRIGMDRMMLSAYSTSAAERMRLIDTWRMDPKNIPAYMYHEKPQGAPEGRDPYDAQVDRMVGGKLGQVIRSLRYFPQTALYAKAKDVVKGFQTMDFLVRRNARYFGSESDATNPLNVWKRVRDVRRSHSNQLQELAERMVNSKWMKLSLKRSEVVGDLMQTSSLWQIDPSRGTEQPKLFKFTSKRGWERKVAELNAIWETLTPLEKDIYHSTQKYFKQEYSRVRRAAIDMAFDMYGQSLPAAARTALYGVRKADQIDALVGPGKAVDVGTLDANQKFADALKDLIKISTIEGPYFPLFRSGDYVVEADREGLIGDGTDDGVVRYASREDAEAAAADVRSGSPRNTAKVMQDGDAFVVKYKVYEISFHKSPLEAGRAVEEMKQRGIYPKNGVATRKISDVVAGSMTEGMKALVGHAQRLAGKTEDGAALSQMLETAFVRLLAEKAASYSQQINRKGYSGMKGREAHETFAKRVRSSSWHYANLKTSLDQAKTLNRLRTASRATDIPVPSNMTQQEVVLQRGDVLAEVTRRLRIEAEELDRIEENSLGRQAVGQVGFVNFLATPSFGFVNAMQTFNVALPFISAKYGMKGTKAMMRAMSTVTGPTMAKVMRGLASKPGHVTSYDVFRAIESAVADHPRYGKFAKGEPSAIQQLVDRGTITASFVQELQAIANNQNLRVAQGVEYLGLIPQGAEQWNRMTVALAILDVTNGNVDAAADVVDQTHFNYQQENRPRYFRKVAGLRLPQALTMFKMYTVGMYQLSGSLIVDSLRGSNTKAERARSAMALAGIIAAHTMSAGVMRGLMMEPLRALIYLWNQMPWSDDDEFKDLDTAVQLWAAEVAGSELGARILSTGIWNAIGFDMSTRMGLDKMAMFRELEGTTEDDFWKYFGQLLGPIPAMIIQKAATSMDLWDRGKHLEAIYNAIPVRMLQDARKAWNLMNRGVETRAGVPIVPADQFNWIDVVGTAAGFRTTEAAKASDLASTEFTYKGWKKARAKVLIGAYTRAVRDKDAAAKAEALAAIREFNKKNPHDPITGRSVKASFSGQEKAAEERRGEGRNRALNELMQY